MMIGTKCFFLLILSSLQLAKSMDLPGYELPQFKAIDRFAEIARNTSGGEVTDKVNYHSYNVMYGMFLLPIVHSLHNSNHKFKMLEIGLGCDMQYGPGKSVAVWQRLFGKNTADLWEAEFDKECVDESKKKGLLEGISVMTGDQGNTAVLNRWLEESGGHFHAIIDDGGHKNSQIKQTFDKLFFEALLPGGLYFIEDLHVGRKQYYNADPQFSPFSDTIQAWIDQLLIPDHLVEDGNTYNNALRKKFPLPLEIEFIFCQHEACVIDSGNSRLQVYDYHSGAHISSIGSGTAAGPDEFWVAVGLYICEDGDDIEGAYVLK